MKYFIYISLALLSLAAVAAGKIDLGQGENGDLVVKSCGTEPNHEREEGPKDDNKVTTPATTTIEVRPE